MPAKLVLVRPGVPAQNLPAPGARSIAETAHMRSRIAIWRGLPCWNTVCEQSHRGRPPLSTDGKIVVNIEIWRGGNVGTELQRRRFTADEYHRMAESGVLRHEDRVELVDGEIVEMTPIGSHHAACVDRLNLLLHQSLAGQGIVRVQGPV